MRVDKTNSSGPFDMKIASAVQVSCEYSRFWFVFYLIKKKGIPVERTKMIKFYILNCPLSNVQK